MKLILIVILNLSALLIHQLNSHGTASDSKLLNTCYTYEGHTVQLLGMLDSRFTVKGNTIKGNYYLNVSEVELTHLIRNMKKSSCI